MLQTDRTDTGRIIESAQITQMPLGFNRNFQALLITVPGASRPFRPHSEFYNSQDSLSSNINGQGRQSNNVQLEGADNSDNGGNLAFMIPSAEAIETVAVTTSNYDAEFGRAGGAVTNVTLKTGTNKLPRIALQFRQHRSDRGAQSVLAAGSGRCQVHAGRLDAGRSDQAEQAVLLRRFRADQRRQRPPHTRPRARRPRSETAISARRRRRIYDPVNGQCERHRPHAVREQSDSRESHQPNRTGAHRQDSDAEYSRAQRSGRPTSSRPTCERSGRSGATSRLRISWRRTIWSTCATAVRTPARLTRPRSVSTVVSNHLPERAPIPRKASARRTTASGPRRWCRRFGSGGRTTTTRRFPKTTS